VTSQKPKTREESISRGFLHQSHWEIPILTTPPHHFAPCRLCPQYGLLTIHVQTDSLKGRKCCTVFPQSLMGWPIFLFKYHFLSQRLGKTLLSGPPKKVFAKHPLRPLMRTVRSFFCDKSHSDSPRGPCLHKQFCATHLSVRPLSKVL